MGRYVGIVKSVPSRSKFGFIKSTSLGPDVPFDLAAFNAAGGPVPGAGVSFEFTPGGKAHSVQQTLSKNYNAITRRKKVVQSPAGS